MRKEVLFGIFLIVLLPIAYSAVDIDINEAKTKCYPNGEMAGELIVSVPDSSDAYTFSCSSIYATEQYNENNSVKFECYADGKKKTSVDIASGEDQKITIITKERTFNESKSYRVKLEIGTKVKYLSASCPGYLFSCDAISLKTSCRKINEMYEVILNGLPEINEKEVISEYFEVFPNYRIFSGNPKWDTGTFLVQNLEDDRYFMKVYAQNMQESVAIKFTKCPEEKYTSFSYSSCRENFVCSDEKDCPEGFLCENSACKELKCDPCEYLKDKKCVPRNCDDFNPCTTDGCAAGKCTHNRTSAECCAGDIYCEDKLACTANRCIDNRCTVSDTICKQPEDNCQIAVCKEPDGCMIKGKNAFCSIKLFFRNLFKGDGKEEKQTKNSSINSS